MAMLVIARGFAIPMISVAHLCTTVQRPRDHGPAGARRPRLRCNLHPVNPVVQLTEDIRRSCARETHGFPFVILVDNSPVIVKRAEKMMENVENI